MRKRTLLVTCVGILVVAGVALAQDQGVRSVIGNVFLQNKTPGIAQVGHATITGTFRAGQVFVQQGSTVTIPVVGNNTSTTGNTLGGSFSSASSSGIAVRGTATSVSGSTIGVKGIARSQIAIGVLGSSEAAVGGVGVRGECIGNDGAGVSGTAPTGFGVHGVSATGIGIRGISISNAGVAGTSQDETGVAGTTAATSKSAVTGSNNATTGRAPGGQFTSSSSSGIGVLGTVNNTAGFSKGVVGESKSTIGGEGVHGISANTGAGFGVHGQCLSPNGFGVFCEGNQAATGTKSFIIDHPLDPENRYLKHYCAEGPDPRNVYMGDVRTDNLGYAWVTLPDYYESINIKPQYQLTVIDSSDDFVLAKVTQKVSNGRFRVRTSKPFVEVSWRIDAIRNDRWVQAQKYSAEPPKPQIFRGTYLNPELFGRPMSQAQTKSLQQEGIPHRP